jgi:hypothetical protein
MLNAITIRWVTQRGSWADLGVSATGGEAQLSSAQLSIARSLHVSDQGPAG